MSAALIAAAPFVLNAIMGVVKWAGAQDMSTSGKRFLLAIFSVVGVVAANSLMGVPTDPDSISSYVQVALESLAAFVAAHGSYHLFWKK